jgi:hypothetical protein
MENIKMNLILIAFNNPYIVSEFIIDICMEALMNKPPQAAAYNLFFDTQPRRG